MNMPMTRKSITRKVHIADTNFFVTIGLKNGEPKELFIKADDPQLQGWGNAVAILWSLCLQAGVPWERIAKKMRGQHFEPEGFTKHDGVGYAKSMVDYIAKWMSMTFEKGTL